MFVCVCVSTDRIYAIPYICMKIRAYLVDFVIVLKTSFKAFSFFYSSVSQLLSYFPFGWSLKENVERQDFELLADHLTHHYTFGQSVRSSCPWAIYSAILNWHELLGQFSLCLTTNILYVCVCV